MEGDGSRERAQRLQVLIVGLAAVHLAVGFVLLLDPSLRAAQYEARSDAARFYAIATHSGVPYVDFPVEYPPVLVLVSMLLAVGSFDAFITGVVAVSLICDLAIAWILWRSWGPRACAAYLVLAAPVLAIALTRLDLLPAALAVAAFALVAKPRRQTAAGSMLAIAAFTKLWPAALASIWIACRRWVALGAFAIAGCLGLAAWVGLAGIDGIEQVLTYRGADGWQVESIPGTVLVALGEGPERFEGGAWRVGNPPAVLSVFLVAVAIALVAAVGVSLSRARRDVGAFDTAGSPALAVVLIVLTTATLLSPQFLAWLPPWAAIAYTNGDRRSPAFVLAAMLVTVAALAAFSPPESDVAGAQILYWIRNLLLVAGAISAATTIPVRARGRAIADSP